MSLSLSLSNALSGLKTTQAQLGIISNNISNVNVEGYSRQIANLRSVVRDGQSSGVEIASITRKVSEGLVKQLRVSNSIAQSYSVRNEYYERMQDMFGSPQSSNSLVSNLGKFANAISQLAQAPDNGSYRNEIVRMGKNLADKIQSDARQVQEIRRDADQQIKKTVDKINAALDNIMTLNAQISSNRAANVATNDLEDSRDRSLKELSQYIDISSIEQSDGSLYIAMASGPTLLDASVNKLSYTPSSSMNASLTYPGGGIGAITLENYVAPGDVTTLIRSGELRALIDLRDTTLPNISAQLEELSTKLAFQVNKIHNRGTSFPAPNSLTGTLEVTGASTFASGSGSFRIAVVDASGKFVADPFDYTIPASGTVQNIVDAINASPLGAGGFITASIVDNRLVLTASSGNGVAINENTSSIGSAGMGFSHYFGLNDFFTGTDSSTVAGDFAASIKVRDSLIANPNLVTHSLLALTSTPLPTPLPQGITNGDARNALALSDVFNTNTSFSAAGGLAANTTLFADYAATMISSNATDAKQNEESMITQQTLIEDLSFRAAGVSGVNMDEEMSNLIVIQNSYSAAARIITATNEMMKLLEDLI